MAATQKQFLISELPTNQQSELTSRRGKSAGQLVQLRVRDLTSVILAFDEGVRRRIMRCRPLEKTTNRHVRVGDVDTLSPFVNFVLHSTNSAA